MLLNPEHIVSVRDFSPETLREMIAHLEASTEFEHLVYRESELDAVWSITGFALKRECDAMQRTNLARMHEIAHVAHDLVADRRPKEAAELLRSLL